MNAVSLEEAIERAGWIFNGMAKSREIEAVSWVREFENNEWNCRCMIISCRTRTV